MKQKYASLAQSSSPCPANVMKTTNNEWFYINWDLNIHMLASSNVSTSGTQHHNNFTNLPRAC